MELIKLFSSNTSLKKEITGKLFVFLIIASLLSVSNADNDGALIASVFVVFAFIVSIIQPVFQMKLGTNKIVNHLTNGEEISYKRAIYYCIMQVVITVIVGIIYFVVSLVCMILIAINQYLAVIGLFLILILTFVFLLFAALVDVAIIEHMIGSKESVVSLYLSKARTYYKRFKMYVISAIVIYLFVILINSSLILLIGSESIVQLIILFILNLFTNIVMLWITLSYTELITNKLISLEQEQSNDSVDISSETNIDEEIEAALDLHND